jgi:hypothetical protein
MANYPERTTSTIPSAGFVYTPDPAMVAYNNARAAGSFTVALATTTTVSNVFIKTGDVVILAAANEKAADVLAGVDLASSCIYVSSVVDGSFIVTHDSDATVAGAIFYYSVFRNF